MTPGFAKSRKELFWLPYPEPDKVIINAHNFTPAGPTLLGGEVAMWIATFDDAGNGTTTLNDFVGSDDGTLTNFALTGSTSNWVADTDASGVRCLAHDGSNDVVRGTGLPGLSGTTHSFACWVKIAALAPINGFVALTAGTGGRFWQIATATQVYVCNTLVVVSAQTWVGAWTHIAFVASGSSVAFYRNGTLLGTGAAPSSVASGSKSWYLGDWSSGGFCLNGRMDDARVFNKALTAGEVSLLASKRGY